MNEELKKMLAQHNVNPKQQTIHISGDRLQQLCTDISGKWVPIQEVQKLMERINELEKQIYGSR
jgi:hypothetical protein